MNLRRRIISYNKTNNTIANNNGYQKFSNIRTHWIYDVITIC